MYNSDANGPRAKSLVDGVLEMLPPPLRRAIRGVLSCREDYPQGLSEIRLRAGRGSLLVLSGENIPISAGLSAVEAQGLMRVLCRGSRYSCEDTVREGYISLPDGIRVGIIAEARYGNGELAGVDGIRGFVFRFPTARSEVAEELFRMLGAQCRAGMLIFAPPSGGKTSALRALSGMLGSRGAGKRVVVIDERCEFSDEDYRGSCVDIVRGYKKKKGIEIALRSLSPEILVVDELIGDAEATALLSAGRGGVRLLASIHAESVSELRARSQVRSLIAGGVFDLVAGIFRDGGARRVEAYPALRLLEGVPC